MQTAYGVLEYRQHDVMSASPIQLVIMAYDQAIKSLPPERCGQGNQGCFRTTRCT